MKNLIETMQKIKQSISKQKIITAWNMALMRVKTLKRTQVSITIMAVITIFLLFFALFAKTAPVKTTTVKTTIPEYIQTTLQITNPKAVFPSSYQAEIQISTNQNKILAVGLRISFDPNVLTNIDIKPGNFFLSPTVLAKNVSKTKGIIAYDLVLPPGKTPVKGNGTVATITFSTQKPNVLTALNFLSTTKVMDQEHSISVLKKSGGITFNTR
jgi:hypothetical protein